MVGNGSVEKAREFAVKAHGKQLYGELPYSVHLDAVASLVKPYGAAAEVIAYLHDVVEDTDVTIDEISTEFGVFVSKCVAIVTDEPGKTRKERKAKTYEKMAHVNGEETLALLVKSADRLANVRACVAESNRRLLDIYLSEYSVFKQSVYRESLCEEIWLELQKMHTT
ncbi:HD domain-containing protein [Neptunomonas sp.]|uniref:HD domain-containing protein n=1 Tax=Neptunomonas sp. TaxID=1971898 RepID=UPI0025DD90EB|nr:HD domain-containing protein [Neptunomonas sp.]